jgi:hypothetical protein
MLAWDRIVDTATRSGLDGPGIESRWGKFSATAQAGSGTHPDS